jgi:cysteine desulfurase
VFDNVSAWQGDRRVSTEFRQSARGLDLGAQSRQHDSVIYFDHNATSPLLPEARAAWLDAEDRFPGNPSSPHRVGARADAALDDARQKAATLLGCSPLDLVWTSGATESCNCVLHHITHIEDEASKSAPIWLSAIEHPAVLETARYFFADRLELIPVGATGVVEVDWIADRLKRTRPALVGVMAANNETGVLQPWQNVQQLCVQHGVRFFCDATQWCGRLAASGLGACDFVAGSAHKFGGPRGVGFLKCDRSSPFVPLLRGGSQQERRRAGTENVPSVVAMIAALTTCEERIASGAVEEKRAVRDAFEAEFANAFPSAAVNGAGADRLWNTASVLMPESDGRRRWVVKLDKAGFAVSTGSACASGSEKPSHVLSAMGVTPDAAARGLRFSSGWLTRPHEWKELLVALESVAEQLGTQVK